MNYEYLIKSIQSLNFSKAFVRFFTRYECNKFSFQGDYYACAHWPNPYKYLSRARSYYQLEANNETLPKPCLFR